MPIAKDIEREAGEVVALRPNSSRALTEFKPEETFKNEIKSDAIIEFAVKTRDWSLLAKELQEKAENLAEFVHWWDHLVGVNHGAGRGNKKNAEPHSFSVVEAEALTNYKQYQVSRLGKRYRDPKDREAYVGALFAKLYNKAMMEDAEHNHRAQGTGENEWYTPNEYLDAARDVLGDFDLDPATSESAQKLVKAKRIFTREDDGLKQEWHGRVWLNPPYTQPDIANFVHKMVEERKAERVTAGIMLTHNYTDTAWFHEAVTVADAICFTRGRIKFYDAQGNTAAPTQGQIFFYFGDDIPGFATKFSQRRIHRHPLLGGGGRCCVRSQNTSAAVMARRLWLAGCSSAAGS